MKKELLKIWFLLFLGQLISIAFVYLTVGEKIVDTITTTINLVYFCLYTICIYGIYLYKTKFRKNGRN